jgi:hypothetical protein
MPAIDEHVHPGAASRRSARVAAATASVVLPLSVATVFVFVTEEYNIRNIGNGPWFATVLVGYACLMTVREWRRYAIYIFLLYVPGAAVVLLFWSIALVMEYYGGP